MDKTLFEFLPKKDDYVFYNHRDKELDRNGNFYHITQQSFNRYGLYSMSVAKYRDHLFKSQCEKNGILVICNVIMPTHTHDVVMTDDFKKLQDIIKVVNVNVAKYVRKERLAKGKKVNDKIFDDIPTYICIHSKEHLFCLFKYLYENPRYLKEDGQFVPYSCFDEWEKGYYKPYNEKLYIHLFGKSIGDITKMCSKLSKEEFCKLSHSMFYKDNPI